VGLSLSLNTQPFVHHYLEHTSVQVLRQKQQKVVDASLQARVIVRPSYLAIMRKVCLFRWGILTCVENVA
jgi:hypothetical protein